MRANSAYPQRFGSGGTCPERTESQSEAAPFVDASNVVARVAADGASARMSLSKDAHRAKRPRSFADKKPANAPSQAGKTLSPLGGA